MVFELVLVDDKTGEIFTTVELEDEIHDALLKLVDQTGKTMEDIILEAIKEGLENAKKSDKKGKRKSG